MFSSKFSDSSSINVVGVVVVCSLFLIDFENSIFSSFNNTILGSGFGNFFDSLNSSSSWELNYF